MKSDNNFTFSELQYIEFAVETSRNMNFFFSVTILPIGVILNVLSGIVFMRRSLNNKTNMGFLCAVFCLFNTIALVSGIVMNSFLYNYIELADSSKSACQFFSLWNSWTLHMPSFQQVEHFVVYLRRYLFNEFINLNILILYTGHHVIRCIYVSELSKQISIV